MYRPVDRIDEASLRHDIYYREHPSERERIAGDNIMLKELREIPNPTCRERFERIIVYPLLLIKKKFMSFYFMLHDAMSHHPRSRRQSL